MSLDFPEEDWLRLHQIRPHAIERLCKKAIHQIAEIQRMPHLSKHDAYLKISDLVRQEDRAIEAAFGTPKRTNAIRQIRLMIQQGILTPAEISSFTKETQIRVELDTE
ncbi:MAG: hypothetical protein WCO60_05495 [Verrucomicrobiota bacterium]